MANSQAIEKFISYLNALLWDIPITDLLEYCIGPLEKLSQQGSNVKACCPFHGEKTPSFGINTEKGLFNCFSCGEHGGRKRIIEIYAQKQGLDYLNTAKIVLKEFGIDVDNNSYQKNYDGPKNNYQPNEEIYYNLKDIDYTEYKAISGGKNLEKLIANYNGYSKEKKLQVVYTFIYYMSLLYKQKYIEDFNNFHISRGLDPNNPYLKGIGYVPHHKNYSLFLELLKKFPKEDLIEFGAIRQSKKTGKAVSAVYVTKGGYCVAPHHAVNSDLCAGVILRITNPQVRMNEIKIDDFLGFTPNKPINTDIYVKKFKLPTYAKEYGCKKGNISPAFPTGLTIKGLKDKNKEIVVFAEGYLDATSLFNIKIDEVKNNMELKDFIKKILPVGFQGINNWGNTLKPYSKYLKDKKIAICFDQDKPGQDQAKKLKTFFNNLNIECEIINWNPVEMGSVITPAKDLNDILNQKDGNKKILKIVEKIIDSFNIQEKKQNLTYQSLKNI